jgi:DNA adenine methylase
MQYLGGKGRMAAALAEVVLSHVPPAHRIELLEPFLGGANSFEALAPHFQKTYVGDAHPDLVLMWQAIANGWSPPEFVTEDQYNALRNATPSALRGFVGFGCSFGGKWFGGYARGAPGRNYAQGSARAVSRIRALLKNVACIANVPFTAWPIVPGVVLYCDPPYAGTTGYATGSFDHAAFWRRMREWSDAGSYVFVSEESGPAELCVWEHQKTMSVGVGNEKRARAEKLFYLPPRFIEQKVAA